MKSPPIYAEPHLQRSRANHVPLSPVSLLKRTARVHPERTAVVQGDLTRTWAETEKRCKQLASALRKRGVEKGHTVAILAPNIPELLECHFAVPMIGAVLNANNTRLEPESIAYILDHSEASVFLVDSEYAELASAALQLVNNKPWVVEIVAQTETGIGQLNYETLLLEGDENFAYELPDDEWDAITVGYTSGTTGVPKGVVYSHRGAYLNAVNNTVCWAMPHFPVYLWTLPMFHCNSWCFPWSITLLAGTHVFLRKVEANTILDAIVQNNVTHLCGAPVVMSMLISTEQAYKQQVSHQVNMMTAAAPPPPTVISAIENLGIAITHVYGLTEVYGPAVVCAWKPAWDELPIEERARLKARQGVAYELQEDCLVLNPATGEPVPADGETLGEIVMRGNIVMKGYLKAPEETAKAFADGWFWTGDLAVTHADGYIEIRDRSKDIIISGGENISSIDIEKVLFEYPGVAFAAVVAQPDEHWGERPCGFVELMDQADVTETDLLAYCRQRLAGFKQPVRVVIGELPKTSTGKIRKNLLRDQARKEVEAS